CNRLAHEAGVDQLAYAAAWDRRIIGDDREISFSLPHELIDDALGRADAHKSANHEAGSLRDHGDGIFDRKRFHRNLSANYASNAFSIERRIVSLTYINAAASP